MKKKLLLLVMSAVLLMSFFAMTPVSAASAYRRIHISSGKQIDLDGNGKADTVTYGYDAVSHNIVVTVNGKVSATVAISDYENGAPYYRVFYGDIKSSDRFKELFVDVHVENGFIMTYVLRYNGKKLSTATVWSYDYTNRKYVRQKYFYTIDPASSDAKAVTVNKKGSVSAYDKCDVIGSFYYSKTYKLTGLFSLKEQVQKYVDPHTSAKAETDFVAYTGKSLKSSTVTIKSGQTITFVKSDLRRWARFTTSGGKSGWLCFDGVNVKPGDVSLYSIMPGLPFWG